MEIKGKQEENCILEHHRKLCHWYQSVKGLTELQKRCLLAAAGSVECLYEEKFSAKELYGMLLACAAGGEKHPGAEVWKPGTGTKVCRGIYREAEREGTRQETGQKETQTVWQETKWETGQKETQTVCQETKWETGQGTEWEIRQETGWELSQKQREALWNTAETASQCLCDTAQRDNAGKSYEALRSMGMKLMAKGDVGYPERLYELEQPPLLLYYFGELPKEEVPTVAVVGARSCSVYGEEMAARFAGTLSAAGIQIISGMARGIDASAQRAAIECVGRAYAVLGSGADVCYPREQKLLYERLKALGGVISEEIPGSAPYAYRFPKRNRIISALSDGVLVVEAREKSGSLITAGYAIEQGRDVYAVPGRLYDRLSEGTNRLIQDGAFLVRDPEEILLRFSGKLRTQSAENGKIKLISQKTANVGLETEEKIVYANLSLQPKHIEELAAETGFPIPKLTCLLLALEMKHYIRQPVKNYFVCRA